MLDTVTQGFDQIETQLPGSSDLGAYTAGTQLAITKLAALFCDSLVVRASQVSLASLGPPVFGRLSLREAASAQLGTEAQRRALEAALDRRRHADLAHRAAGVVDLPEYLAGRLNIDEGSLHAEYEPATGSRASTALAYLAPIMARSARQRSKVEAPSRPIASMAPYCAALT